MSNERRVRRSEQPREAARLFLEQIVAKTSCKAIALATDHGFLLTGVGEGVDLEWLAAMASIGADVPRFARAADGEKLQAFSLRVGDAALHVASVGEVPQAECEETLARICAPLFQWAA